MRNLRYSIQHIRQGYAIVRGEYDYEEEVLIQKNY